MSKLASTASDWDTVNSADRFGAMSKDEAVSTAAPAWVKIFSGGNAGSAYAWKTDAGIYKMTVDLDRMELVLTDAAAIGEVEMDADADAPVVYYNLQGVPVANPGSGAYIRVKGSKVEKVYIH